SSDSCAHPAIMPLHTFAQRCKRFSPLLAAPAALLLSQGQAKALLTYNIFESAGNVVVQTNGSLNLTGAEALGNSIACENEGVILSSIAVICTGFDISSNVAAFKISGPTSFNGSVQAASSIFSGISTILWGSFSGIGLDPSYLSNTPIVSSSTYNGATLASLGFTTTGLIGTWTLNGTTESINVFITPPVPGPLPCLGVGAAFGWSRRLRKRITAPLITPPQA
ncbi:MAG: hypothetical protein NT158_12310, partial [Cyanobacteria bacterium]|nr:hypothetical protein [Cyanobacteriota bacterium]